MSIGGHSKLNQEPTVIIRCCVFRDALILGVDVVEVHAGGNVNRSTKRLKLPIRNTINLIGGRQSHILLRRCCWRSKINCARQAAPQVTKSYYPFNC